MTQASFDYVIVGAGTAGCLLANRLSANPQHKVLLLEAGGSDSYHWIHIPVGYLYCIGNPRTDWMYHTEPAAGLNGRSLRYPRGKALGGCSSINGMIYMRGQSHNYDHWAQCTGEPEWHWQACLPDFMAHEGHHRLDPGGDGDAAFAALHGAGGEWRVEKQRLRWEVLDAFAQAAQQAGIPASTDFNGGSNEGVGYFEVNQHRGWRWNTTKAFLRSVQHRPNLTVWTHAHAQGLQLEPSDQGWRCHGLRVRRGQHMLNVQARQAVVLAAGSIGSPQLLQLSGIGPGTVLQRAGVPVQIELPGVGANLQDHLQIRAVFQVANTRTLNTLANHWWGKAQIGLEYLWRRTGPMSMAPSQLGIFTRSRQGLAWPNIQFHVQPLSLDAFGEPLHRFDAMTVSVCNLAPTSRGTVHIQGPQAETPPAIAPNYLATDEDRLVAAESLRVARHIAQQPAMVPYAPQEIKPGVQYQSDDDLARLAGDIATTIFHPVGTTAMGGNDDPMAVLDGRMRVRDGRGGVVQGLRVVDAGAMPTITSGNTNSPTLMMAEKAARWLQQPA